MDICRGSMLVQPWTDRAWLTPPERQQMADFIALVKQQPDCFRNSRWILGDPWKNEAYGYSCTDGKRAFLAINNSCWRDNVITLELGPAWGLPAGGTWDIYRYHPNPARLIYEKPAFGSSVAITLRPFEVILLEVVPAGQAPTLNRKWISSLIPTAFAEPMTDIVFTKEVAVPVPATAVTWTPMEVTNATTEAGSTLTVLKDGSVLASGKNPAKEVYTVRTTTHLTGITAIQLEMLNDPSLPKDGPGRAVNGNFLLTDLQLKVAPVWEPAMTVTVALRNAQASYSQLSYGGFPVAAAIDGNADTGWSIYPNVGHPHVAIFETGTPVGLDGGTIMTITLAQDKEHNLGRFRLSVTTAKPPVPVPAHHAYEDNGSRRFAGKIPPTTKGGTLVVIAPGPLNVTVAGQPVACISVWRPSHVKASWQAWRIDIVPSTVPQAILVAGGPIEKAYFIPLAK